MMLEKEALWGQFLSLFFSWFSFTVSNFIRDKVPSSLSLSQDLFSPTSFSAVKSSTTSQHSQHH